MATKLEEWSLEKQRAVVLFSWTKGLRSREIYKEMRHVYEGEMFVELSGAQQDW